MLQVFLPRHPLHSTLEVIQMQMVLAILDGIKVGRAAPIMVAHIVSQMRDPQTIAA